MTIDALDWEGDCSRPDKWSRKVWGLVCHCFFSHDVAMSILKVDSGFRCSRHLHKHRANTFWLISGVVDVWEWVDEMDVRRNPNQPVYVHRMKFSDPHVTVNAGRPHMFRVIESGTVVEIYTPDGGPVDIEDITRFDEGGPDDVA